jgi:hypothetical protein
MPTEATSNRDRLSLEVGAGQRRFQKAMIPEKKLALEDALFVAGVELVSGQVLLQILEIDLVSEQSLLLILETELASEQFLLLIFEMELVSEESLARTTKALTSCLGALG